MKSETAIADARQRAVEALSQADLASVVDLVAYPDDGTIVVGNHAGAVRLHDDGTHEVLHGRDPVANTDPMAFTPYEAECAEPSPENADNAYPDPYRRLASCLADPSRSPDVLIVHTPRHFFPEQGGHLGEHGSLDVIQSRAPMLLSGAGVRPAGVLAEHSRIVDVAPTLLHAAGVGQEYHRDAAGAPLEGRALTHLVEPGQGRFVIGLLWDGAHCGDLLHLASTGALPGVARLLDQGLALAGGAVAEFPSITLCNHTSALTGVGPGRHGVLGNVYFDRATGETVVPNDATTWHRTAEWLRPGTATVFEMHAAARPQASTACVNEPIERGAGYSTMALIRAAGTGNANQVLDDQLPAATASPYLGQSAHLDDDYYRWATRVDDAGVLQMMQLYASAATAPALTWWSNAVTDAGHHAGGPRSAIARDSFADADRRLQALLSHLDDLGITQDITFMLTADHGFEGSDPAVRGDWAPALYKALSGAGISYRDEGPGFLYLNC